MPQRALLHSVSFAVHLFERHLRVDPIPTMTILTSFTGHLYIVSNNIIIIAVAIIVIYSVNVILYSHYFFGQTNPFPAILNPTGFGNTYLYSATWKVRYAKESVCDSQAII